MLLASLDPLTLVVIHSHCHTLITHKALCLVSDVICHPLHPLALHSKHSALEAGLNDNRHDGGHGHGEHERDAHYLDGHHSPTAFLILAAQSVSMSAASHSSAIARSSSRSIFLFGISPHP